MPRDIHTLHDPPPIPSRRFDWQAWRGDWDMGEPIGYGRTEAEAVADLTEAEKQT